MLLSAVATHLGSKIKVRAFTSSGNKRMPWRGEQYAPRVVHLSFAIALDCTCTAYLLPKSFEASLFRRAIDVSSCIHGAPPAPNELQNLICRGPQSTLGCSFGLENNSNPRMGCHMPLDSSTLPFKSDLNAHAMPI